MYAVIVRVKLPDGHTPEAGTAMVNNEVIPRVRQNPGASSGYWLFPSEGNQGLSFVLYDTEANANAAADRIVPPPGVELVGVEVRQVIASF